jgi:hypothetical protein
MDGAVIDARTGEGRDTRRIIVRVTEQASGTPTAAIWLDENHAAALALALQAAVAEVQARAVSR